MVKEFIKNLLEDSGFTEDQDMWSKKEEFDLSYCFFENETMMFGYGNLVSFIWLDKIVDLRWLLEQISNYQEDYLVSMNDYWEYTVTII